MELYLNSLHTRLALNERGTVISLNINGEELVSGEMPLFRIALRDQNAARIVVDTHDASTVSERDGIFTYTGFSVCPEMTVTVTVRAVSDRYVWGISVEHVGRMKTEWTEFPLISVKQLERDTRAMLYPYNEGAYVDDLSVRENSWFGHAEPEYPSSGAYSVFPNMVFAQFLSYLWKHDDGDTYGLYLGAHDKRRGAKAIDFYRHENGRDLVIADRIFCGVDRGDDWSAGFDTVWEPFHGTWETGASIYRAWFENNLPPKVKKIAENPDLPDWYKDAPVVVSYPVRGIHDMDTMEPNRLFPYTNALPLIDEIQKAVENRILVLLMHWEGTAPWAPPYVWPPYGGTENFFEFLTALHEKKNLLGVYCSGFGYTIQSNLIKEYSNKETFEKENLETAMCAGPDGKVSVSRICEGQRAGYDLCPASDKAREILENAYRPLLESQIDYVQILDQNHGGGQYLCYSDKHGHPAEPGPWMTENMQKLLRSWNDMAGQTLLGCESAAAEPFIGNLLFSDNRYELNWHIGKPVPLYAFLYHEYIRNFMGNQVCSPFPPTDDTLRYRMGYAFAAGDCLTLVCTPDGEFMVNWGCHDFSMLPDKKKTLRFAHNLCRFYREEAHAYLYNGRMTAACPVTAPTVTYACCGRTVTLPQIFTTAWETADKNGAVQLFVNPGDTDAVCTWMDRHGESHTVTVPANDAISVCIGDFA